MPLEVGHEDVLHRDANDGPLVERCFDDLPDLVGIAAFGTFGRPGRAQIRLLVEIIDGVVHHGEAHRRDHQR